MKPRWTAVYESINHLHRDESGQDLIEYAAVGALIGLAALMSIHSLSNKIDNAFTSIGNGLTNAI